MAKMEVQIPAPNFRVRQFHIRGTTPYMQNKMSARDMQAMMDKQAAGSVSKSKKNREPRDFDADCAGRTRRSDDGRYGIPAGGIRNGLISACRTVGFKMTHAKLAAFVEADCFDADDGQPLVAITKGEPERRDMLVNIQMTTDIRSRPVFAPGWEAVLTIRYDGDMFSDVDMTNLVMRLGQQVGIGSGRPDSPKSAGLGYGLFDIVNDD